MKQKILSVVLGAVSLLALAGKVSAAVTLNFASYTGSGSGPDGLPFVNSAGASIPNSSNSLFASIGYLTAGGDNTPASILSRFVAVDTAQTMSPNVLSSGNPRNSLFNGVAYTNAANALPSGVVGQNVVVLIGNTANISASTAIALFSFSATFLAPDPINGSLQNFALTAASVPTVGTLRTVTTQPLAQTNTFVNGVQLVSVSGVPEPSAALLGAIGALGLLRRRRI